MIRTFGSKRELFIRTHAFAGELILRAFRNIDAADADPETARRRLFDEVYCTLRGAGLDDHRMGHLGVLRRRRR